MKDQVTLEMLSELLESSATLLQDARSKSSADENSKELFDTLAQQHHYVLSAIIDYLNQHQ